MTGKRPRPLPPLDRLDPETEAEMTSFIRGRFRLRETFFNSAKFQEIHAYIKEQGQHVSTNDFSGTVKVHPFTIDDFTNYCTSILQNCIGTAPSVVDTDADGNVGATLFYDGVGITATVVSGKPIFSVCR
ncbi:MAG: hypothetical protein EBQ96_02290 [Proteobacteria bacterium]|nr:hypothetical protein [Pseudomonadota bacterium]